jgi:TRAP-type C4-dicarboxylate transport system substrate-binding protein
VVPLPTTDLLTSLQTGLIDAFDVPPLFALLDRSYQQAKYMIDLHWAPIVAATVVSMGSWERIPEGYRAEFLEASRRAGEELRDEIRRAGEEAVEEMKSRGLVVVKLRDEEIAFWRAEVDSAYPKLRELLGPPELHDEARRSLEEYRKANRR